MSDDFEQRTGVVLVALPAADDPIAAASSEDIPHITMIWMGDAADLAVPIDDIKSELASWAADIDGPLVEKVSGIATLGAEEASVILVDATALAQIRDGMLESHDGGEDAGPIALAYNGTEQFPTWIPHVTLGYPETPASGEYDGTEITFDRLALWVGDDRTEYPMGAKVDTEEEASAITAAAVDTEEHEEVEVDAPVDDDASIDEPIEVPWIAVLAIEGEPTGDRRMFADGALSTRELPLPIQFQKLSGEGHGGSSVVGKMTEAKKVGNQFRAKGVFRVGSEEVDDVIDGIIGGFYGGLSVDVDDVEIDTTKARADMRKNMLAAATAEEGEQVDQLRTPEEIDAFLDEIFTPQVTVFAKARIAGATIVAIPAFQEAFIAIGDTFPDEIDDEQRAALEACGCLGHEETEAGSLTASAELDWTPAGTAGFDLSSLETDDELDRFFDLADGESFAPGTHDGPGWITNPRATSRIRRYWTHGKGAGKIRWGEGGDFNRCRKQLAKYVQNPDWLAGLCANMHKEATGIWPATHAADVRKGHSAEAPAFSLVASAGPEAIDASYFEQRENPEHHGLIIEDDLVYGYIAAWGVCHIGIPGKCEYAPNSPSNYAYYRTGFVTTTEGPVRVGQITMGTGHAGGRAKMGAAIEHYDNTGTAIADIVTGEDSYGIWFAGKLRDGVTDKQRFDLAAAGRLSGDWRRVGVELEFVAALAVNVPGFPLPQASLVASAGEVYSLVAAGVVEREEIEPETPTVVATTEPTGAFDAATVAAIARTAVAEYVHIQERPARVAAAMAGLRSKVREDSIARLRGKVGQF